MWYLVWILSAIPFVDLFYLAINHELGPNPQEALLRSLGTWSLVFLLLTYSVSILSRWGISNLLICRRMLGLWTFFYMFAHFLAFFLFEHSFILSSLATDFINRPFVAIGIVALFLTFPLVITSNNYSVKFLKRKWKKLHFLINPVIILTLVHFYLHRAGKNDFFEPFIALGVFLFFFCSKYLNYLVLKIKNFVMRLKKNFIH